MPSSPKPLLETSRRNKDVLSPSPAKICSISDLNLHSDRFNEVSDCDEFDMRSSVKQAETIETNGVDFNW